MANVTAIEDAKEAFVNVSEGIQLWYQTWGCMDGIPVLFVHGGPGNCVEDYKNVNSKFFDKDKFFVVEVDQRGTGKSRPSVRDAVENMKLYEDVSIALMSADFEVVREELGIERWLVFGGSWGSTLGIDYAERFPDRCRGLIVRGIFLNTQPEFDEVYARKSFLKNVRRLKEFDVFFELAAEEAAKRGENPLDPNDSERFIRLYESMILSGNRNAIWRFYVFENNLVEEDPDELLNPLVIADDKRFREAQSVSFFECRLFLRGTFEEKIDLLGSRLSSLRSMHVWVVQGTGDEVCPETYAKQLVDCLASQNIDHTAHFVDASHKCSSDSMSVALRGCVEDFLSKGC